MFWNIFTKVIRKPNGEIMIVERWDSDNHIRTMDLTSYFKSDELERYRKLHECAPYPVNFKIGSYEPTFCDGAWQVIGSAHEGTFDDSVGFEMTVLKVIDRVYARKST